MKTLLISLLSVLLSITACQIKKNDSQENTPSATEVKNPPAPGFNAAGSDIKAIEIADMVMEAMGGREAWDNTRCIEWNFFGSRTLIWDKKSGKTRIDYHNEDQQAVINIQTKEGKIRKDGVMITNPDSLSKYLERAYHVWINDSYWLLMPFKLKDSGVTLKYIGEDTTLNGNTAYKLQLTFEDVGVTPQNKYHVWIDKESNLVSQWAFFREFSMDEPNFINPWTDYNKYGEILLSGNRGERQLTDIAIHEKIPEGIFSL